jgi:hypothetical protein
MPSVKSHFHQYYNNLAKISKLATSSFIDRLIHTSDGGCCSLTVRT